MAHVLEALGLDPAALDEMLAHSRCAPTRELDVVLVVTLGAGVAGDLNSLESRRRDDQRRDLREQVIGDGLDRGGVVVELDLLVDDDLVVAGLDTRRLGLELRGRGHRGLDQLGRLPLEHTRSAPREGEGHEADERAKAHDLHGARHRRPIGIAA